MSQPLPVQIWSHPFCKTFDALPPQVRESIERKIDEMGRNLATFGHERLVGRPEFRLRVGDFRVLYAFDLNRGQLFLLTVGHRRDIYK